MNAGVTKLVERTLQVSTPSTHPQRWDDYGMDVRALNLERNRRVLEECGAFDAKNLAVDLLLQTVGEDDWKVEDVMFVFKEEWPTEAPC